MSKNKTTYHEELTIKHTLKLRELLQTLPPFAKDFFRAIEPRTSSKTRISYAYDLRVFFQFLIDNNPKYKKYEFSSFQLKDLSRLEPIDIEEYQEYLKVYKNGDKTVTNMEKGQSRKLSSLRTFFKYYHKHQYIEKDPTSLIDMPKLHEKAIVRLESDEIAELLDYVENCSNTLSGQALNYFEKTKNRDLAILTLLLGTGIRVSECVGLDLNDINFKRNGIKVTRKGGNEMIVYFGDEVSYALKTYIYNERQSVIPCIGHEQAVFLSTQKKRMGVQAVENMVKKYAKAAVPNKKITPHKLRSTYGTALYKETGDIYLVADVLGHKDVNTTKKHYAAIDDDRRKSAGNIVKLR